MGRSAGVKERWAEQREGPRKMERSGEIWNMKGGGGDLIVEGQGRVTASNQLTVALHSSIWDTTSPCMHVCVFNHL